MTVSTMDYYAFSHYYNMVLTLEIGIGATTFRQKYLKLYQTPDGKMKGSNSIWQLVPLFLKLLQISLKWLPDI